MEKEIVKDGITYRLVTLRGRSKYVSKEGKLLNPYRNQKVTLHYNEDGYPCCGGGVPVHLYVAHGWVDGWFEGAEVNHKDFDRNNYNASNLEWVTHKENVAYTNKYNYTTVCMARQGINNGRATFTEEEVRKIRRMYDEGNSIADIVRTFYPDLKTVAQYKNIHSTFSAVARRKTWKSLPEENDI